MKRLAALVSGLLLVGVPCVAALAQATGVVRPTKFTASVLPPHRDGPPFEYTTAGVLTFPSTACPPGIHGGSYCFTLTGPQACKGGVTIKVDLASDDLLRKSDYPLGTLHTKVHPDCTYSASTKIDASVLTAKKTFSPHARGAWAHLTFSVMFDGNVVLAPRTAHDQHVLAHVQQPSP